VTAPPDHRTPRRRDGIVMARLDDGQMVFDPTRVRAHVLNRSAATVWACCDGATTVEGIVAKVSASLDDDDVAGLPIDIGPDVERTIEQLVREGLLHDDDDNNNNNPELEAGVASGAATVNRFANVPHTNELASAHEGASWAWRSEPFQGLDVRFEIETDDETLGRYLAALLDPLREAGCHDSAARVHPRPLRYSITAGADGAPFLIALDGFVVGRPVGAPAAAAMVMWHVNQLVSTGSSRLLQFHASGVTANGVTIAFPASMNSGKSTLVTALVQAGFAYVTDETVAVEPDTLLTHPYPKAIGLDPGSWRLFPQYESIGAGGDPSFFHRKWYLDPRSMGVPIAERAPLGLVVLPRYFPGGAVEVARLDAPAAALELAQNSFNLAATGQHGVDAIARIAQHVPCYRMGFDDLDDAVRVIRELAP